MIRKLLSTFQIVLTLAWLTGAALIGPTPAFAQSTGGGGGGTPNTCANPCTIGSVSIRSGSGVPSASDPQGSLNFRTDVPSVYQMQTASTTYPAWVQGASVNGGTVTVAPPAGGNYLVAACDGGATIPTASSGWTLISSQAVGSWGPAIAIVYHYFATTGSTSQTPCTGSVITTSLLEISGLDPSNFNTNYVSTTWAQNGGASSVAVSVNTTADNTLALAIGGSSGASGAYPTLSFSSGYANLTQANTAAGQSHSIGMATHAFSTNGTAAGQTVSTSPGDYGVTNAVLLLKPTTSGPSFGWQQMVAIPTPATSYTVATLPRQATNGARAVVTDANATCTFNAAPTGGGSTVCAVWWNGTAWVEG